MTPPKWVSLGQPSIPNESAGGSGHFDVLADPADPNVIYVSGWSQAFFRVNAADPSNASWTPMSLGSLGNPHDDQRGLAFLNDNLTLLDTNDGGIYALLNARNPSGGDGDHWVSINENMQDTEFFHIAYDSIDGTIAGGSQDNGSSVQISSQFPQVWTTIGGPGTGGGDGGAIAIDDSQNVPLFYVFADGVLSRARGADDCARLQRRTARRRVCSRINGDRQTNLGFKRGKRHLARSGRQPLHHPVRRHRC